jgi:hypothetical protein
LYPETAFKAYGELLVMIKDPGFISLKLPAFGVDYEPKVYT